MGLCAEVRKVKALELVDYINYTGAYEDEMGIGRPPEFTPLLEHTDILVMSWGATVPMMAHAVGIELDEITSTWDKWVTDVPITTAKGVINAGEVAAIHFTINGMYRGEPRICLEHVNRVGTDAAPDWPGAPRTTSTGSKSRARRRSRRRRPSVSPTARARRRGGRLPGHWPAGPQCRARRQRPASRVGHRLGSAAHPRGGDHPLSTDLRCRCAGRRTDPHLKRWMAPTDMSEYCREVGIALSRLPVRLMVRTR